MVVQNAHVQKYTEWRSNQVNQQMHVKQPQTYNQQQTYYQQNNNQQQYVHQQPYQQRFVPMTFDRQVVMRQSNRSLSPVQTQKERGRSTTRQFVYAQQPNASLRIQKVDAPLRSKSAPPINRGTIQRVVQREPIMYTTSHFMAIRKPGSKKYLLPPTKVYTEARETNRTVVVERRAPQPRQPQKVVQGNVYHVHYNPETANIVRNRGYTISGEQHRMVSAPVSAPTTPRYYQQPQEFVFSRRATDVKQPIKLASYTPKIIQGTQLTTENRTHTWSASNGGVANGTTVWSSDDMHVTNNIQQQQDQSVFERTSSRKDSNDNKNGEPFTIVDYIEDNSSRNARQSTGGIHDSSGLQELDKYLDIESSNSSSPKSGR